MNNVVFDLAVSYHQHNSLTIRWTIL